NRQHRPGKLINKETASRTQHIVRHFNDRCAQPPREMSERYARDRIVRGAIHLSQNLAGLLREAMDDPQAQVMDLSLQKPDEVAVRLEYDQAAMARKVAQNFARECPNSGS